MKKIAIGIAAVTALIGTSIGASAQSTEAQSTDDIFRRLQAIEASNAALAKENAALREENTKLRGRVSELKGSNQTATAQQTSTTSASALNRTSSKVALYDKASSNMVVKAPPPAPAPIYNWSGWYVGGNVGYSWGDARTDIAGNGTTVSFPTFGSNAFTNAPAAFADSATQRLGGSSGAVKLVIIINSVRNGCWASRLTSKPQANGEVIGSSIHSQQPLAIHRVFAFRRCLLISQRSTAQRRRLLTPTSDGLGRFAVALVL